MKPENIKRMDRFALFIDHPATKIGFTQLRLLLLLAQAGKDGAIVTEAAEHLGITPGAVSRQVDKLGNRGINVGKRRRDTSKCMGLVREWEDEKDFKALRIGLTDKGWQWLDTLEHEVWPTAKPGATLKVS